MSNNITVSVSSPVVQMRFDLSDPLVVVRYHRQLQLSFARFSFSSIVLLLQPLLKALICDSSESVPRQLFAQSTRLVVDSASPFVGRLSGQILLLSCPAVLSLSRLDKINDWLGPRKEPNGLVPAQVSVAVEMLKLFAQCEEIQMKE
jgi:hypothetical protein